MKNKEFDYLLKLAEKSAKKLWNNKEDDIWNNYLVNSK
jgi:hypothetical protein